MAVHGGKDHLKNVRPTNTDFKKNLLVIVITNRVRKGGIQTYDLFSLLFFF